EKVEHRRAHLETEGDEHAHAGERRERQPERSPKPHYGLAGAPKNRARSSVEKRRFGTTFVNDDTVTSPLPSVNVISESTMPVPVRSSALRTWRTDSSRGRKWSVHRGVADASNVISKRFSSAGRSPASTFTRLDTRAPASGFAPRSR